MRNLKKKRILKLAHITTKVKKGNSTPVSTLYLFSLIIYDTLKTKKSPRVYNKIVPLLEGGGQIYVGNFLKLFSKTHIY